jgi:hypothetical protein
MYGLTAWTSTDRSGLKKADVCLPMITNEIQNI